MPKDQHELVKSNLNPNDKQNFASVNKICNQNVINLLQSHVSCSYGTAIFLKALRNIIDSFLDIELKPLERVEKIWHTVFLFRLWRKNIVDNDRTTLKNNFLTNNCYSCIELNAHGLVKILLYLKETNQPNLFLPHLLSSQPWESLFRQVRSMTTTHSTVVNFSIKEILDRVNRIQLQNHITYELSDSFVFPRLNKPFRKPIPTNLPTKFEICIAIEHSKKQAIQDAFSLGLIKDRIRRLNIPCPIQPLVLETKTNAKKEDYRANVLKIDPLKFKSIVLKNFKNYFSNTVVDEASPFVELPRFGEKRIVLKKSSLCWLLRDECCKISSDRLQRVRSKKNARFLPKGSSKQPKFNLYPNIKKGRSSRKKVLFKYKNKK